MVFSLSGLMLSQQVAGSSKKKPKPMRDSTIGKKKKIGRQKIPACIGIGLNLQERSDALNPFNFSSCSQRCRHPVHPHTVKERSTSTHGSIKNDKWVSEHIYKRYTDTDSRPNTPEGLPYRSIQTFRTSLPTITKETHRKCLTPEPETKQCQYHSRRILVLDLRRVKSVDAITRQDSITTTGTDGSIFDGDDDGDSSVFHQLSSPRNRSLSRSATPSNLISSSNRLLTPGNGNRRFKKSKERSVSPIAYERSSSPKILEGKLRRHGRRRKSGSRGRDDGSKEEKESNTKEGKEDMAVNVPEAPAEDSGETQMSIFSIAKELAKSTEGNTSQEKKYFSKNNIKSLHHILDDHLGRRSWHSTVDNVASEIKDLEKKLATPETKLKPGTINLKEDLWLSFPRTWSHTSGTFRTPKDPQKLKEMSPLEYLQSCVRISEPRQHLYNLVFQRYRAMENPLGKTIQVEVAKRALAEVIGQQLKPQQIIDLFHTYLDLPLDDQELSEPEFRGIAALCERIFGKYSLEDSNECYVCAKYPNKDKNRCHQNQGDLVEQADLEYLSRKIRDKEVGPNLARLIQAICSRELNFH